MEGVAVHRAGERYVSRSPGVRSWHSLSFGPHYDPANTSFGPLVLHDEHELAPGAGFPPHPHRGVEVVSWVLDGLLVHTDDSGAVRELGPGSLQHLSAGRGTVHAERAGEQPTRFVQAWLLTDRPQDAPAYASTVPDPGLPAPVLRLGSAVLHAGGLTVGASASLGTGGRLHAFVASGSVAAAGAELHAGDALRWTRPQALVMTATQDCHLLVWEMQVTTPRE